MGLPDWLLPKQINPKKKKRKPPKFSTVISQEVNRFIDAPNTLLGNELQELFGKKGGWKGAPFGKYDKISDKTLDSFSPAQGGGKKKSPAMPRQTFAQKKKYGRTGYKSRAYKPRTSMKKRKRTMKPTYRSKKRTKRKIKSLPAIKGVKRHFDDYGTIARRYCLWMGVQEHGSMIRMLEVVGESLMKAALGRMGAFPSRSDDPLNKWFPTVSRFECTFRRIDRGGGVDQNYVFTINNLETLDYGTFCSRFVRDTGGFRDAVMLDNSPTGPNQHGQINAYFPTAISFTQGVGTDQVRLLHLQDVEASLISFAAYSTVKLQNKSLNDQGDALLDVNGVNPLEGKIYTFKSPAAKVRSELQAANALYDVFADEQINDTATGVIGGPVLPATNQGASDAVAHPVRPQGFFKNRCTTNNVHIRAGAAVSFKTSFQFSGNLQRFCEKVQYNGFGVPGLGGVKWLAVEKKYRDNQPTAPGIELAFNRDSNLYANMQIRSKKYMLRAHFDVPVGAI